MSYKKNCLVPSVMAPSQSTSMLYRTMQTAQGEAKTNMAVVAGSLGHWECFSSLVKRLPLIWFVMFFGGSTNGSPWILDKRTYTMCCFCFKQGYHTKKRTLGKWCQELKTYLLPRYLIWKYRGWKEWESLLTRQLFSYDIFFLINSRERNHIF